MINPFAYFQRSVAAKVMIAVTAALALVVGLFTHLILQMRRQWVNEEFNHTRQLVERSILDRFASANAAGHRDAMHDLIEDFRRHAHLYTIRLVDQHQQIAYSTITAEQGRPFTAIQEDAPGSQRDQLRAITPLRDDSTCQRCHSDNGTALGALVIDYPQEELDNVIRRDQINLLKYAVAVLVMMGGVILILVWTIVQTPLTLLATSMQLAQNGDLASHCEVPGNDQFHRLADGFNAMVDALAANRDELQTLHVRQLAQADRLASVGKLASGLAHEIKTPLHGVNSALTIVRERSPDPVVREVIDEMHAQIGRTVHIVEDMLKFARPSKPVFAPSHLPDVLHSALTLLQADIAKQQAHVTQDIAPDLPALQLDANKFQQVLLNLLLNAIQAIRPGGNVAIRLHPDPETQDILLTIEDDGSGIGPEQAKHIFEPFYTTKTGGNGLGLLITRTLVEQHQGHITLVPGTMGGACFAIRLPAAIVSQAPSANPEPPTA